MAVPISQGAWGTGLSGRLVCEPKLHGIEEAATKISEPRVSGKAQETWVLGGCDGGIARRPLWPERSE